MAHVARITNGTTTVTLTSSPYSLTEYAMRSGEPGDTVDESPTIYVRGETPAALATNVRAVQKLLNEAADPDGAEVFIEQQLAGDSQFWRSKLTGGSLEPIEDVYANSASGWVQHSLNIVRESEWEGARVAATFSGGGTTKAMTNGATNYAILGALDTYAPTRLELRIKNNDGFSFSPNTMFVALDYITGWTGAEHRMAPGVHEWASAVDHDVPQHGATIPDVDAMGNKPWHLIGAFTYMTPGAEAKGALWVTIGGTDYIVDRSLPIIAGTNSGFVANLGTYMLPPNGRDGANGNVKAGITVYHGGAGDANFGSLYLFPANTSRRYEFLRAAVPDQAVIVDDMIEDAQYVLASGVKYPQFRAMGQPLVYLPGKTNRIYIVCEEWNSTFPTYDANLDFVLEVYYRPKRLTL